MQRDVAEPAAPQPRLQGQVDNIANLANTLDHIICEMDAALDRLVSRTPHPVPPGASGSAQVETRQPIAGLLDRHIGRLQGLCKDADALLARINAAV